MTPIVEAAYLRKKNATDRQTDMDGPIRCPSLTLQREEIIIIY
jgi:hypothetical protein